MARPPVPVQPKATWLQTGAQMMAQGDYRGAVRAFEHAVRQAKGNGLPHYYLAHAHLALRQFGSAAEELTDALRLKPDLLDAARFMDSNECRTVIAAARTNVGLASEDLLQAMNEAGKAFREAIQEKFGRRGEF